MPGRDRLPRRTGREPGDVGRGGAGGGVGSQRQTADLRQVQRLTPFGPGADRFDGRPRASVIGMFALEQGEHGTGLAGGLKGQGAMAGGLPLDRRPGRHRNFRMPRGP